jgi:alkylated DNA repair dioxygenase AlkB
MSRKRDAAALVRRVFGSDDESSENEARGEGEEAEGGTPVISGHLDPPPPVRFLAPDRERHVGPLADSIPGLHLVRGAFTREAQAWLLDAIRKEGLVETPHPVPAISVASRVAREAPSRAYEAIRARRAKRPFTFSATKVKTRVDDSTSTHTPLPTRTHIKTSSVRKNQAMRFGNFPRWAATLADSVARLAARDGAFPALRKKNGESDESDESDEAFSFDQYVVNAYLPGEGLKPHVDLAAFDDGVCVVSLLSSTVMDLSPAPEARAAPGRHRRANASAAATSPSGTDAPNQRPNQPSDVSIGIRLDPGDALFLSGDARWRWRHGIAARAADARAGGGAHERGFRVSVALRTLREEGRELRVAATARPGYGQKAQTRDGYTERKELRYW